MSAKLYRRLEPIVMDDDFGDPSDPNFNAEDHVDSRMSLWANEFDYEDWLGFVRLSVFTRDDPDLERKMDEAQWDMELAFRADREGSLLQYKTLRPSGDSLQLVLHTFTDPVPISTG